MMQSPQVVTIKDFPTKQIKKTIPARKAGAPDIPVVLGYDAIDNAYYLFDINTGEKDLITEDRALQVFNYVED